MKFCYNASVLVLSAAFILGQTFCSPASAQSHDLLVEREAERLWRLSIDTDGFTGQKRCRLRSRDGKIVYLENVVGFRLGSRHDLSESWFRIDNGAALRWRDQRPELARLQIAFDERAVGSLETGWLWFPLALLEDARQISVATGFGAKVHSFRLDGLLAQLRNARERGCLPENRFVL